MSLRITEALVSCEWLLEHLARPELRILDCSQLLKQGEDGSVTFVPASGDWAQAHIPGSIHVDVNAQLSDPDQDYPMMMPTPERLAGTLRQLGVGDGCAVVLYDRGNHAWAARVWWMLRVCGFDNAAVLDGGWKRWQQLGYPETAGVESYPPADVFSLRSRPELMADRRRVQQALSEPGTLLLHSLPPAMFSGEVVAYARPGRIPGSRNLYCETLLDPDTNCYLPRDRLRQLYAGAGVPGADCVITYCGGGIAASSNALGLTLVGADRVAVYDASLSEWAADPELPMETG